MTTAKSESSVMFYMGNEQCSVNMANTVIRIIYYSCYEAAFSSSAWKVSIYCWLHFKFPGCGLYSTECPGLVLSFHLTNSLCINIYRLWIWCCSSAVSLTLTPHCASVMFVHKCAAQQDLSNKLCK